MDADPLGRAGSQQHGCLPGRLRAHRRSGNEEGGDHGHGGRNDTIRRHCGSPSGECEPTRLENTRLTNDRAGPVPGSADDDAAIRRVFSDAPWEREVGYCRALQVGDRVFVTGTAPVGEDGGVHAPGDAYAQAARCFELIRRALAELDVPMDRVVRTRMFVTDIERWAEFGRAHAEAFGTHPPTTTMVEVRRLIDPEMLIEVEADAVAI
ncbi:MAG: RidA family protein [Gemmatimonadetes bacterium]|nr:RidA family protein [Gemmatimonadota bacterium]